ncbi:hypothetical protein Tco_1072248 [Tanacetum coccineum]
MATIAMSVVYVLTTPIPEDGGDDPTVKQVLKRNKWDNNDYVWRDFKHTLKHKKEELTLVELGSHLRIEESLRAQDSDKPKGNNVVGLQNNLISSGILNNCGYNQVTEIWSNIVNNIGKLAFMSTFKLNDSIIRAVVRLHDPKIKTLGERGIECIFVGYAEHSKAFRFYVIEPNESVSINSIIESNDAIFDENRFSLLYRPSLRIPNKTKYIGGTRDEVSDQHSYCFNATNDPKTFDEAMKSYDVAFWKEEINDRMDSIMGNNTWVLVDIANLFVANGSSK